MKERVSDDKMKLWPAWAKALPLPVKFELLAVVDLAPWATNDFRKSWTNKDYAPPANLMAEIKQWSTLNREYEGGSAENRLEALNFLQNRARQVFNQKDPVLHGPDMRFEATPGFYVLSYMNDNGERKEVCFLGNELKDYVGGLIWRNLTALVANGDVAFNSVFEESIDSTQLYQTTLPIFSRMALKLKNPGILTNNSQAELNALKNLMDRGMLSRQNNLQFKNIKFAENSEKIWSVLVDIFYASIMVNTQEYRQNQSLVTGLFSTKGLSAQVPFMTAGRSAHEALDNLLMLRRNPIYLEKTPFSDCNEEISKEIAADALLGWRMWRDKCLMKRTDGFESAWLDLKGLAACLSEIGNNPLQDFSSEWPTCPESWLKDSSRSTENLWPSPVLQWKILVKSFKEHVAKLNTQTQISANVGDSKSQGRSTEPRAVDISLDQKIKLPLNMVVLDNLAWLYQGCHESFKKTKSNHIGLLACVFESYLSRIEWGPENWNPELINIHQDFKRGFLMDHLKDGAGQEFWKMVWPTIEKASPDIANNILNGWQQKMPDGLFPPVVREIMQANMRAEKERAVVTMKQNNAERLSIRTPVRPRI